MKILDNIRKNRIKRRELLEKTIEEENEIRKQKIKSRENITKTAIEKVGNRDINIGCPFLGINSDGPVMELAQDPENREEPFGWPRGTVRGILTLIVVEGFFLMTMLMLYMFDMPLTIVFDMWKILAGVFGLVVASYFWSRVKMGRGGNMFNPFGGIY